MPFSEDQPQNKRDEALTDDEIALVKVFSRSLPGPSERFYKRMAGAPWNSIERLDHAAPDYQIPVPSVTSKRRRPVFRISSAAAVFLFSLFLLIVILTPAGRSAAQRIAQYFVIEDTDRTFIDVTPIGDGQLSYDFGLTSTSAQELAGFPVKLFDPPPASLTLIGAEYLPTSHSVILQYRNDVTHQILQLTEQQLGRDEVYASIGASAAVEPVKIGSWDGEYVTGGWRVPELPQSDESQGFQLTLQAEWDPDLRIQVVRWQEDKMLYEIFYINAGSAELSALSKSALIRLAENME